VVGIGALVVMGAGSAVAATGHNLILGAKNSATKTTTLSDAKGTPLSLVAKTGKPPLAVSNSTEVKKLNAALLDGLSASGLLKKVTGHCATGGAVVSVSPSGVTCRTVADPIVHVINISAGVTATDGGTYLKEVLAAITAASATNGYLINLGPGVFDLGTASLTVPSHVDVAGSGQDRTTITSSVSGGSSVDGGSIPTAAPVELSAATTLRDLAVVNTDASTDPDFVVGILSTGGTASVADVDLAVSSGEEAVGLAAEGGSTMLAGDVGAIVDGSGFAEGGRADTASRLAITDSTFVLPGAGLPISAGTNEGSTVRVVNSQIPSAASFNDGSAGATVTCFGDYTEALSAATC
jgi:hypothetical protein